MRRPPAGRAVATTRRGIGILAAVVVVAGAVWVAAAIYLGLHLFGAFRVGLSSCLPADFPHYPHATVASIVISDSLGDCTIQYRTRDTSSDVMGFFEANLNEGDWMVEAVDEQSGLIRFQRNSNPNTIGYVKVLSFPGQQTQFQIQIRAR